MVNSYLMDSAQSEFWHHFTSEVSVVVPMNTKVKCTFRSLVIQNNQLKWITFGEGVLYLSVCFCFSRQQ